MNKLQVLFNDYIKGRCYKSNDESKGTIEEWRKCENALSAFSDSISFDISDKINSFGVECEELGFINGFRYGVQIMAECMPKGGASV